MGNCISNTGGFEPPGASKVAAFVAEYDRSVDPRWIAAELRAAKAEEAAAQVSAALDQLAIQKTQLAIEKAQKIELPPSPPPPSPVKKGKREKRKSNLRWKRCPQCSAMVELEYGCNQITTTCKEHFQAY